MELIYTGNNDWEFTKPEEVWSSISFAPAVKVRPIVKIPSSTDTIAEMKIEFQFAEGTDRWFPLQLQMIAPNRLLKIAEYYNLEARKKIDISSVGVKDFWEFKVQGFWMRIGLKASQSCTVDFETWFHAEV